MWKKKSLIIILLVLAAVFALVALYLHFYAADLFSSYNSFGFGRPYGDIQLTIISPPVNGTGVGS